MAEFFLEFLCLFFDVFRYHRYPRLKKLTNNQENMDDLGFKVQGSGLAHGACYLLIGDESSSRQLEMRSVGAAHKNQKRRGV